MATQVTNYKCPSCTGPLHFAGGSGQLECEYCGSVYEVEYIEDLYAEKDKAATEEFHESADGQWEKQNREVSLRHRSGITSDLFCRNLLQAVKRRDWTANQAAAVPEGSHTGHFWLC